MNKGRCFQSECTSWADPLSGLRVTRLTNHDGGSHHLYFTNCGWYENGKKLIFASTRAARMNLFSMDLSDGTTVQLTELEPPAPSEGSSFIFASLNPARPEVYFWHERQLVALNIDSLEERCLYNVPRGYAVNMTSVTANGTSVCTAIYEDLSAKFAVDLLRGYVGFDSYWQHRPHSIILSIDTVSGAARVIYEKKAWIGHVNASPTDPSLATFCHEGPWEKVDQRIWGLDLLTGKAWAIRPRQVEGEKVGHEFWLADGRRIGFHAYRSDGTRSFGIVEATGKMVIEHDALLGPASQHFHSNDGRTLVSDGNPGDPYLYLHRLGMPPQRLTRHDCSSREQIRHVHPRFSPDGRQVLYVSDVESYGNLYLVDLDGV